MEPREFLRRLRSDPEPLTIDDEIQYLEGMLFRDKLSRETRRMVRIEIEELKKKKVNTS